MATSHACDSTRHQKLLQRRVHQIKPTESAQSLHRRVTEFFCIESLEYLKALAIDFLSTSLTYNFHMQRTRFC